ncbi:hypothetical protein MAPG_01792 [Magnaporthiopsis poae ATCC 64411]|uniref:Uncharacterized protein n=1 Tax=Magnaporthiopsis poae (strain ATCC 64411 / 73-15) TaxID=644358 RepID=A0A0C4DPM3_MAGP6|nr:hypothetical protein MAPG_01792 [Magnaporthiopsis poae ATCC 64411]
MCVCVCVQLTRREARLPCHVLGRPTAHDGCDIYHSTSTPRPRPALVADASFGPSTWGPGTRTETHGPEWGPAPPRPSFGEEECIPERAYISPKTSYSGKDRMIPVARILTEGEKNVHEPRNRERDGCHGLC